MSDRICVFMKKNEQVLTYSATDKTTEWTNAFNCNYILIKSGNIKTFTIQTSADGVTYANTTLHGTTALTRATDDPILIPLGNESDKKGIKLTDTVRFDTNAASYSIDVFEEVWLPLSQFNTKFTPTRMRKRYSSVISNGLLSTRTFGKMWSFDMRWNKVLWTEYDGLERVLDSDKVWLSLLGTQGYSSGATLPTPHTTGIYGSGQIHRMVVAKDYKLPPRGGVINAGFPLTLKLRQA